MSYNKIEDENNVCITVCAENEIYVDVDEMAIETGLGFNMKQAVKELTKMGWKVTNEFTGRVIMEK